jgi:6-phosphogluconate dehydrogenase
VLKTLGGLTNAELASALAEWNTSELSSFLVEISSIILAKKDDQPGAEGYLLDKIVDASGSKGTGGRAGGKGVQCGHEHVRCKGTGC